MELFCHYRFVVYRASFSLQSLSESIVSVMGINTTLTSSGRLLHIQAPMELHFWVLF